MSHIFSYITLSTIQLIILVACIILLTRDVKRRGGLCVNFIHSHQTITLLLCSIFSLGNFSELTYFRCHFTLPSNGFNFASDLFHFAWDTKIYLVISGVPILLQAGTVFLGKQASVDFHAQVSSNDRHQHISHWKRCFDSLRTYLGEARKIMQTANIFDSSLWRRDNCFLFPRCRCDAHH